MRSKLCNVMIAVAVYLLAVWALGPTGITDAFVALTAIDHWHANWPDSASVDAFGKALPPLVGFIGVIALLYYVVLTIADRRTTALASSAIRASPLTYAVPLYRPTREEFHADLARALRQGGVGPAEALDAADGAMTLADTDKPADWAGRVREEALSLAGIGGTYLRVNSRDTFLTETAGFLSDYGYRVVRLDQVGLGQEDEHNLNFTGLIVWHRTEARDAEDALIELLITAHQAHMQAMHDNGSREKGEQVERAAQALRHVATKLALRGFVPPELDAEVGRDGVASAEELERWAIAQVVAVCSPMASLPLPTVERGVGALQ